MTFIPGNASDCYAYNWFLAILKERLRWVTDLDGKRIVSFVLLVVVLGVIFYPNLALGMMTFKITDSGAGPAIPLYVKYSQIALHRLGEGEKMGWIELLTNATSIYDLSTLKDTTETVLRSRMPVGKYDKLRLRVVEVTASINGTKINLSVSQPVLTMTLDLEIAFGEEKILLVDFKSNSTKASINKAYESSPVVTVLKTK